MIDVLITRFDGDQRGEDVIEPLLGSLPTAIALGRSKLDAQAQKMQPITIEAVYRDGLRRGQLLDCVDSVRGEWVGKIVGLTHRSLRGVTKTTIRLVRVTIEPAT
jgi:hypothetical protein